MSITGCTQYFTKRVAVNIGYSINKQELLITNDIRSFLM